MNIKQTVFTVQVLYIHSENFHEYNSVLYNKVPIYIRAGVGRLLILGMVNLD